MKIVKNADIVVENFAPGVMENLGLSYKILEKINQGEGTLGMLVNNDSLYQNLSSLSQELDLLLKDLQENPKKYINVSVFGKSDKKKNSK